MLKKRYLILLLFVFFFFFCPEEQNSTKTQRLRIDTPPGMINYLGTANLPALKSVEVWDNQYAPGLVITTAHYEIFTTLMEPLMLSQVPGFMESCYRGYQNQLPKPVLASGVKSKIYLFASRAQWEKFTKTFTGRQYSMYRKIKKGAYYLNGACVAYNIGRERTFCVLGHEGWHQFNSRHFKYRLPSWLDEGIAMLFENTRYDKGLFYFEPARNLSRLGSLRITLTKNKMIPLENLISLNPGEVVGSEDAVRAFYSQSYALVRFLREEDYGRRLPSYHTMLMDGYKGLWPLNEKIKTVAMDRRIPLTVGWNRYVGSTLFEEYIGNDFEGMQKEYKAFCRKIVYHVRFKK